jgi:uncharacterized Zn-finger protein
MEKSLKSYILPSHEMQWELEMEILQEGVDTKNVVVKCDGGAASLGHPVIYLNVGKEEKVICPYCNKCFVKNTA